MKLKKTKSSLEPASDNRELVRLWSLRILAPLGGHKNFIKHHGCDNEEVEEFLGLTDDADFDDEVTSPDNKALRAKIRKLHKEIEKQASSIVPSTLLANNIGKLTRLLGLTDAEARILTFLILLHTDYVLLAVADYLGSIAWLEVNHVLSVVLKLTRAEVRASLSESGLLVGSGLLQIDNTGQYHIGHTLGILSGSFAEHVLTTNADPIDFLHDSVFPSKAPTLGFDDFAYMADQLTILRTYLRLAVNEQRKGVNIFIYGVPGIGKTQIARLLAQDIGCTLFEVASGTTEYPRSEGEARFRSFCMAQNCLGRTKGMLLFDEAEDIFMHTDGGWDKRGVAQQQKAKMNIVLEENRVPVIWISNHAQCIDPAFMRRFDMVMELPIPPQKKRLQLVRDACGNLISLAAAARISAIETLAPAVVTRASAVVRTISHALPDTDTSGAIELLIKNTLLAQGHSGRSTHPVVLPQEYDPSLINTDFDMAVLIDGLKRTKSGKLCFYGAPGTGKSALGYWIADALEMPIHVKRCSDIIDAYVGQTEKNLAKVFRQATTENAILLLDEVDSFLRDRQLARHSWETTAVNEMLAQMEEFNGILIASTNLMDNLDSAAMRRFDAKIKFDYLQPEQSWQLFKAYLENHGNTEALNPAYWTAKLATLTMLALGDFAVADKQACWRKDADITPEWLLDVLTQEVRQKKVPCHIAPIGFHVGMVK